MAGAGPNLRCSRWGGRVGESRVRQRRVGQVGLALKQVACDLAGRWAVLPPGRT